MYCENCGQQLEEDAIFCGHCGEKVTPFPEEGNRPAEADMLARNSFAFDLFKILKIVLIILSIALAVAAVVLGFKVFGDNGKSSQPGKTGAGSKTETAVTGDLYTDVENQQLFAKNGVIVDRNGEILDEYSWLICLQNGDLYDRESDVMAEDLSTKEDGMLYYRIPGIDEGVDSNHIRHIYEIVEKLLSGTSGDCKKESYLFDSGYWRILITEDNLSVQFPSDDYIKDRFNLILGENEGNADSFVYNLKDETIVFLFYNVQVLEGNLEAAIYDRNQEAFYLLIDGEYYEPSDEFVGYMEDYALMDAVGSELSDFRKELSHMDLTVEDLKELDYTGLCEALDW